MRQSAVAPNCARAVIHRAFLPSVENCCQNNREAEKGSEGGKLHFDLVTNAGRPELMGTATNQGAKADLISRSRHPRD